MTRFGKAKVEVALPPWINESQHHVLTGYESGEFLHLLEETTEEAFKQAVTDASDGLLKFLLLEMAESEGVDSMEEALRRVNMAVDQLRVIADKMASAVFRDSVG